MPVRLPEASTKARFKRSTGAVPQLRLSRDGRFGLGFALRVLALTLACWWFCQIAAGIPDGFPISVFDHKVAGWFHQQTTPARTSLAEGITFLGSSLLTTGAVLAGTVLFLMQRDWYRLLALELAVPGGGLLNVLLKHEFHRQRPWFENPLLVLKDYSFPSGHTMVAVLLYGLLCVFAMSQLAARRWRLLAAFTAILLVIAIGVTRIYLGVHYLSDVFGAMAAGVAWLIICLSFAGMLRGNGHFRAS